MALTDPDDMERQRDSARAWAVDLEQQIDAYSNLMRALARRSVRRRREAAMWKDLWQKTRAEQGWTVDDIRFARTADAAGTEPGATR